LADEATIRKLDEMLKRKVDELDRKQDEFAQAAQKIQATE
jgi:hypothetical protein